MTEVLTFSMSGAPRPKGRPRARVQKAGKGAWAQVYTDPLTRRYEAAVRHVAEGAMVGLEPFVGALSVSLRFRLGLAKSVSQRERAPVLAGERPYFGRYDIDNLAKAVLDALNGVCWADDRQITRLFVTKIAADRPGVDVRIEPLEPQSQHEPDSAHG